MGHEMLILWLDSTPKDRNGPRNVSLIQYCADIPALIRSEESLRFSDPPTPRSSRCLSSSSLLMCGTSRDTSAATDHLSLTGIPLKSLTLCCRKMSDKSIPDRHLQCVCALHVLNESAVSKIIMNCRNIFFSQSYDLGSDALADLKKETRDFSFSFIGVIYFIDLKIYFKHFCQISHTFGDYEKRQHI